MLRVLLAGILMLSPSPVTELVVDTPEPAPVRAGQRSTLPVTISLAGPLSPMPAAAGPVDMELTAPPSTGCRLADRTVTLDPLTGEARTNLTCRPLDPGDVPLVIVARSPPHEPGHWNASLPVRPDRLDASLALGDPERYTVPIELELVPRHLDEAEVDVIVRADVTGSPLGFELDPRPFNARHGSRWTTTLDALHGPGTYELAVRADGPRVERVEREATVHVPEPPTGSTLQLNVTVEDGQPSVQLASDSVNDDGKHKRPGDELITRLAAQGTASVEVEVTRRDGETRVPVASQTVPVENGRAEHRFAHDVLPAGLLTVTASAENSTVARTARIADLQASAHVEAPAPVIADGRAIQTNLTLADPNFGSTPADPGPVWGLPNVTWRLFRGSLVADGFDVELGPFSGGPEGHAGTARIAWPNGTSWARVETGVAILPLVITPPGGADPGTYRVSIYPEGDDDRIGGTEVELLAPPAVQLAAPEPRPGATWPVAISVENAVQGFQAELAVYGGGDLVAERTVEASGNVTVELPSPLEAGAPVSVVANATWPGRPPGDGPDAELEATVPALEPALDPVTVLDGVPTAGPLALHPAHPHTIEILPRAADPNGQPVTVDARVVAPDGSQRAWIEAVDPLELTVPAGVAAGRYRVEVAASSPDGTATETLALDVGELTRLRLDGPAEVNLTEGQAKTVALTVRNAGTVAVDTLVLDASTVSGLGVQARLDGDPIPVGEPFPAALAPGEERPLEVSLASEDAAPGTHTVQVNVAGAPS